MQYLILTLIIKAILLIWIILNAGIGLGPDEAQYWTWSQSLAWGYYSKPPGIAWQIWLGTFFFGNTELGVRSTAIAIGFILPILIFFLAKACRLSPSTCTWSGLTMALCPIGVLASFLAITDGGMVLFWTATCILLANALEKDKKPNYFWIGFFIMCGALFKWPIYMLWIFVLFLFPSWKIIYGVAISLIGLLPSIIWNSQHDWVTFRHVLATMTGGPGKEIVSKAVTHGNFWEFFGAQAVLLSPIPFLFMLMGFGTLLWKGKNLNRSLKFCGWMSLIILGVYSVAALFMKMQGNWAIFAYPTAVILLSWFACERYYYGKGVLAGGLVLSILLCIIGFSIPYIQSYSMYSNFPISYKMNPFRHNLGWDRLEQELKAVGYNPSKDFLFGDKYQTSSILSFYGENRKRAYFLNLNKIRKNQFSFWPSMAKEQKGKNGYFVLTENSPHLDKEFPEQIGKYQQALNEYFREVRFLGIRPLFYAYGKVVKGAMIFECIDYNGKIPPETNLY